MHVVGRLSRSMATGNGSCQQVCFLLLMNFVLAIIVEGYMDVRGDIETMEAWLTFPFDIYHLARHLSE